MKTQKNEGLNPYSNGMPLNYTMKEKSLEGQIVSQSLF